MTSWICFKITQYIEGVGERSRNIGHILITVESKSWECEVHYTTLSFRCLISSIKIQFQRGQGEKKIVTSITKGKSENVRFKPKYISNFIKCKWEKKKSQLKGKDCHTGQNQHQLCAPWKAHLW